MLNVFDCPGWRSRRPGRDGAAPCRYLPGTAGGGPGDGDNLPELRQAGVVDAGALGMYVFFEGFFRQLAGLTAKPRRSSELFAGMLAISPAFRPGPTDSFCVNALIHPGEERAGAAALARLGKVWSCCRRNRGSRSISIPPTGSGCVRVYPPWVKSSSGRMRPSTGKPAAYPAHRAAGGSSYD